jgi:hypothetical protein
MSDKEKNDIYIGCITTKFGEWRPNSIVPGCVTKQCCRCNVDIHVSPSSQKLIASKPDEVHVICIECMQKQNQIKLEAGKDVHFMGTVPGAVEEALDQIARFKEENK